MIGFIIAIECALALLFIALYRKFRAHRGRYGLYFLFKRLRTTPGQEQVIRSAFTRLREAGRAAALDTKGARPELAAMLRSESFDESTARSWIASRERSFDNLKPDLISSIREIHGVLDPEQRKTLGDALESGKLGWGHRHHHHGHHHGCC